MAGVGGLEPPRHDPESCVLPLDYTPAKKKFALKQLQVNIIKDADKNTNTLP